MFRVACDFRAECGDVECVSRGEWCSELHMTSEQNVVMCIV